MLTELTGSCNWPGTEIDTCERREAGKFEEDLCSHGMGLDPLSRNGKPRSSTWKL